MPVLDEAKWREQPELEVLRLIEEYETFNKQQCNQKNKILLLFLFSEAQRRFLATVFPKFPEEYAADNDRDARKKDTTTEQGKAVRLEEDVQIIRAVRRDRYEAGGAENPLKGFGALPKLAPGSNKELMPALSAWVQDLQKAWFELPHDVREELVQEREGMKTLLHEVYKKIGSNSIRQYFQNALKITQGPVFDRNFDGQYPELPVPSGETDSNASEASSEQEEDKAFFLDRRLIAMAKECERKSAIFADFQIGKTAKGAASKDNSIKVLEDQLTAKDRRIERLKEQIKTLETEGKKLRDELRSVRSRGQPHHGGGHNTGSSNEWQQVSYGRGRGGKKKGAGRTVSATYVQGAPIFQLDNGVLYQVEGPSASSSSTSASGPITEVSQ
jgi:hypothetical protein